MRTLHYRYLLGTIALTLAVLACNISVNTAPERAEASPTAAAPSDTPPPAATEALPTLTPPPQQPTDTQPAPSSTPSEPTATSGPQCIVQQSLNLRSGPGTAYEPPIGALEAQTRLIPLGYNPVGIPGGPWAQVRVEDRDEIGWVSAGPDFISCNIDLTGLPPVNVPPPPPPPPPETDNSAPDGTFPDNMIFEADFDSQFFVRMYVHDENVGNEDGDGVDEVTFTLRDKDGNLVYQHSEGTAGYCIFGGGEPTCNPWVFEDFVYKWETGGDPVEAGTYELRVHVVLDDPESDEGDWGYQVEIKLND